MNLIWLIRASRWVRNPPSPQRVKLVFAAIVIALLVVGIEWMGWWPEWAAVDPKSMRGPPRIP
ncbi:hypothetical protein BFP70_12810 [Thioclava sp. SK-1]|uniref:hypothetical protein n=1 Tax=Thioclava sp. SK-1 TaxID=1889770 RepID=UPI00082611C7|nr:hypothetical protein [Thioclava sp. SK-1]OCX63090.1 hypothetical protein BFP70_12810 [Thioclava sp. SK-1]